MIFCAKRDILAGEEVTECYGIHHLNMGREERRASLARGYRFECACAACGGDFPRTAGLPGKVPPQTAARLGNSMSKYVQRHMKKIAKNTKISIIRITFEIKPIFNVLQLLVGM